MTEKNSDKVSNNLATFKLLTLRKDNLHEIVEICSNALLQNKIILYPTDTLYGLGANALSVKAVKKIYAIKKRDEKKLLSIMTTKEKIREICELTDKEYEIITKFLPNPFTLLIKPKKLRFLNKYIAEDRIGVRVPDSSFCNELSKKIPYITSTSANISGRLPAYRFEDLDFEVMNACDYVVNGGNCYYAAPSTIIDIVNKTIVRPGAGLNLAEQLIEELQKL